MNESEKEIIDKSEIDKSDQSIAKLCEEDLNLRNVNDT